MTHILSIIHYPVFGGPHNSNMRLIPFLQKKGIQTTVLLPEEHGNAAEKLKDAGIQVVLIPLHRARATLNIGTHFQFFTQFSAEIREISEIIQRLKIDIVQINGLINPHGAIAAHRVGVPVVWQILDIHTPVILRYAIKPLLMHYADVIMCTGQKVANKHPGVTKRPDRLVNFFPPVNLTDFSPKISTRNQVRQELGIDTSILVIGTVGNINLVKGHDNFIHAAAQMKAKVHNTCFLILGTIHNNHKNYAKSLEILANNLGLKIGQDLIFLDPAGRVHELVQAMDIFWMTSRSEGIPTAMEEAMALKLPIVSFDVGSIGELIMHGCTGYLVQDQDPKLIAKYTLDNLLDEKIRNEMGSRGRHFIQEHAALEVCAEQHIKAYSLASKYNK
ncbi:glycosyltransferase [Candidatus Nitrosacidococcus tergens]|uniref:Glycosyl transferase, group 1 n=1 Tax=Candidatus Nitrosacidococcus tergens TaxID=553981 RepID=A0A7G1Q9L5_9GAMM|nr:glycosyltransferase [Candidatus Nitrosacidococcus tergens]CAB1275819.1 Glycosyl transferase, group 1 [Candidatus Nitrosacidococcus tergens]